MTEALDRPHIPRSEGTFAFPIKIRRPRKAKHGSEGVWTLSARALAEWALTQA